MKPAVVAGVALAVLGAFVLLKGLTYPTQRSVLKVGDLKVSAEETRSIPPWVGGAALVGGVLLLGAGTLSKKA